MTEPNTLNTPWTLHFDRDGTEDIATLCDCSGEELVTSRHFWLPEDGDPVPSTLSALWLMKAAPTLYFALKDFLEAIGGLPITILPGPFYEALHKAGTAIAEAEGSANRVAGHGDVALQGTARSPVASPLPPDPDGLNDARAAWAAEAVKAFRSATGTDVDGSLVDLLTNLMHWADRDESGFEAALRLARTHYVAETQGMMPS